IDYMKGVSSRLIGGLVTKGGTGFCDVILDTNLIEKSEYNGENKYRSYTDIVSDVIAKDIINKLNSQLVSVLNNPEIKSQLNSKGFDVITSSPEQLGEYIKSEISKWAPIVKKSGATAD
ncbi:MAG: hypothetical protein EBY70_06425, partial [Burkholderiaceae bacterium]|nr:hypothetical protein [Burkholderiaceae bacterium]